MIKCKIASEENGCSKIICCCECNEIDCGIRCGEDSTCEYRIDDSESELAVMEKSVPDVLHQLTEAMVQMKNLETNITKFKEQLLQAMEENGVKKFENEKVSFTYVAPTTRKTFDKKSFEKAHPDIDLSQFDKVSNVKSSVRIQVK